MAEFWLKVRDGYVGMSYNHLPQSMPEAADVAEANPNDGALPHPCLMKPSLPRRRVHSRDCCARCRCAAARPRGCSSPGPCELPHGALRGDGWVWALCGQDPRRDPKQDPKGPWLTADIMEAEGRH